MFFSLFRRVLHTKSKQSKQGSGRREWARRIETRPHLENLENRLNPAPPPGFSEFNIVNTTADPVVGFQNTSDFSVLETAGQVSITIVRTGDAVGLNKAAQVQIRTSDESGGATVNYTPVANSPVLFAATQTTATFNIPILNDGILDGNKTFGIEIFNPSSGDVLGLNAGGSVTIRDTFGSGNTRFVNFAFQEFLNRNVDNLALPFFVGQLDRGVGRDVVNAQIVNSIEGRQVLINDLFVEILGRAADPGALNFFGAFIANPGGVQQAASIIYGDNEYFADANLGGGSNATFVESLYQDILDRQGDAAGEASFLAGLQGGATRAQIAGAMFTSQESYQVQVNDMFLSFLNRNADPSGLSTFVGLLQSGVTFQAVAGGIIASPEYFALV